MSMSMPMPNAKFQCQCPMLERRFALDVLNWTERVVAKCHENNLLVIPNYSEMSLTDENILKVANLTDGLLAEGMPVLWQLWLHFDHLTIGAFMHLCICAFEHLSIRQFSIWLWCTCAVVLYV